MFKIIYVWTKTKEDIFENGFKYCYNLICSELLKVTINE